MNIILYGTGLTANDLFWQTKGLKLDVIVDADEQKAGHRLDEYIAEAVGTAVGELKIQPVEALSRYIPQETIILIASKKYYEEILEELHGRGFFHCFVIHLMQSERKTESVPAEITREKYKELCAKKGIKDNKIVFFAFGGYADHEKYIAEALLRLNTELDMVFLLHDMTLELPGGIRKIYMGNWKNFIYEMSTAKIWIYNMPVSDGIPKKEGQIYIQTKHWASITLKKFYLDANTLQNDSSAVKRWKYNGSIMDYIITGSEFDTDSCRRGFEFHGEVIAAGSPRTDALFQTGRKDIVYQKYGIPAEMRLMLYAPTYRFDKKGESYSHESREIGLDYELLYRTLKKKFGGEWRILLRLHPSVAQDARTMETPDFVIDVSDYPDSEELVAASEMMISDYSSIMFEPAFVGKPVFLFATDKDAYIDKEYDLLLDYDTLPFPIAESNERLADRIEIFESNAYRQSLNAFFGKYGVHEDGHASERVAKFIDKLIRGGN